mgnify:CR=1 FL=1
MGLSGDVRAVVALHPCNHTSVRMLPVRVAERLLGRGQELRSNDLCGPCWEREQDQIKTRWAALAVGEGA